MARANAQDVLERYARAKTLRYTHDNQFRMNAAYCLPRDYPKWQQAGPPNVGSNQPSTDFTSRFAFDNTGVRCIPKFVAICKRLINPDNIRYHKLSADDDALMRIPQVREWFDVMTDNLFKLRHNPFSMFGSCQSEIYASLGVYGTGSKQLSWNKQYRTFSYRARPLYDIFFLIDEEGRITDVFRRFALTKRQFKLMWPNDNYPPSLQTLQDTDITTVKEFVHYVCVRGGDYDPKALDARRHKWSSDYICVPDALYIGDEEGFISNPYINARVGSVAGDPYGYSPAEQAFPALGGVNAMKKTVLKQGHKAVDPPLLANDDGALSGRIDIRPGRVTYGGLDSQGRAMVKEVQTQTNFRVAEQLISDERRDIEDSFLVTLFQILTDTPEMTAAEVYERISEKAALFAPTKAAIQEEDQAPQVQREIEMMREYTNTPPMPPELIEARGEYKIQYTNPMDNTMFASEVSGFMRWSGQLVEVAQVTQDASPTDWINWDNAAPDLGMKMNVRGAWINDMKTVQQKRKDRAEQQQRAELVNAAPAIASVAATAAKTGAPA